MTSTRLPFGVSARFPNQSGAFDDVTGPLLVGWKCGGCPAGRSSIKMNEAEASREAQGHATQCSGLPRGR